MARYYIDCRNDYLGKYRRVSGRSRREAQARAHLQLQQWAEQEQRARQRAAISDMKARAVAMTTAVEQEVAEHRTILAASLSVPHVLDWERAGTFEPFVEQPPTLAEISFARSVPRHNWFLEFLRIRSKQARLRAEAEAKAEFERGVGDWEERRHAHEIAAAERRREVEAVREAYPLGAMVDVYLALCLTESDYPSSFSTTIEAHYEATERLAIVELDVPAPTDLPQTARYRYEERLAARGPRAEGLPSPRTAQAFS